MLKRIRKFLGKRAEKAAADAPANQDPTSIPDNAPTPGAPSVHRGPQAVHRPINSADLDDDAVKIVRRLTRFDHTAYLVGGCVRDLLLDIKPKDFDLATSATPRQVKRLFRNCRIIGRRFRLAHIYFQNGKIIEVATYRARDSEDGNEPAGDDDLLIRDDNVFGTIEEDALRRDFTINQLFYDVAKETVIDHADGLGDLRRRLVRTIGDPEIRFREDPIRALRAIKFAARLDFAIEPATLKALETTRDDIHKAAPPRILEEINRFCRGGSARRSFELLRETGMLGEILPEVERGCRDQAAWKLLLHLMGRVDGERSRQSEEIRTGEILAVLLLPLLSPALGWKADGTVESVEGLDVRDVVDAQLRPLGLRLRVPRREQELCRQILVLLARMVPAAEVRRGQKRAILGRECLPDALWILEALASDLGGQFGTAFDYWNTPANRRREPGGRTEETSGGRGRRRRRGSRGRGSRARSDSQSKSEAISTASSETGSESASGAPARRSRRSRSGRSGRDGSRSSGASAAKDRPDMPPPWDDDYFFAALPSAPDGVDARDEGRSDRYGASQLRGADPEPAPPDDSSPAPEPRATASPEAGVESEAETEAPRRSRRRRRSRRGRRRSGKAGDTAAAGGTSDSEGPGDDGSRQ